MTQRKFQKKPQSTTISTSPELLQSRPFEVESTASIADVQGEGFGQNFAQMAVRSPRVVSSSKLTIGQPGDKYEQEADRVAAEVVQKLDNPQSVQEGNIIQEKSVYSRIGRMSSVVQRQPDIDGDNVNDEFESSLNNARSGGQTLEPQLRMKMESAMGADFSGVKVHTDAKAHGLNQSIQARAFTTGQDIFFRSGEYNPGNKNGQQLIAHELAHVVQQSPFRIQRNVTKIKDKQKNAKLSAYERDIRYVEYVKNDQFLNWCIDQGLINRENPDAEVLTAIFAVRQYTQADFKQVNKVLWNYDSESSEVSWEQGDFLFAKQVKKAFQKAMQLKQALDVLINFSVCKIVGGTVYRYEDSSRIASWQTKNINDSYDFKGFMSTTVADTPPGAIEGNDCQIKITITNARGVKLYGELTSHENEEEVLLYNGGNFTVTDVDHEALEYVVRMN